MEITTEAPQPDLSIIHRLTVTSVSEDNTTTPGKKRLLLRSNDSSPYHHKLVLTGQWIKTNVFTGDVISVCTSEWNQEDGFIVSDNLGYIVTNPDNLISCTTVASSLYCSRKTWLNERFKGFGVGNKIMTIGTLVHELLQICTTESIFNSSGIRAKAKEMIKGTNFLLEAYFNEMTEVELESAILDYIPWMLQWMVKYIVSAPSALHDDNSGCRVKITKVHDIEDNIWCHFHGLKGKVDFTVEIEKHFNGSVKTEILPLELKTGKASFSTEHAAQATLYTLMMDKRHFGDCDSALLLYIKEGAKMKEIKYPNVAKNALIMRRNEYEYHLRRSSTDGPDFKDCLRACSGCDHLLDCALIANNFEEDKLMNSMVMEGLFQSALAHLTPTEVQFFGIWMRKLNDIQENEKQSSQSEYFWNVSSQSREDSGQGLSNMVIKSKKKFTYTFAKDFKNCSQSSLSDVVSNWSPRDRVAVSLDKNSSRDTDSQDTIIGSQDTQSSQGSQFKINRDMVAIVTGFVEKIESDQITLSFDKTIHEDLESRVFRIDLLGKSSYLFNMNYNNLLRLMTQDDICFKLRRSVIMKIPSKYDNKISKETALKLKEIITGLDKPCKSCMAKVLTSSHYTLIETSYKKFFPFLTSFLKIMSMLRKRVILTLNSSSLLQDILIHLKDNGISFMKLGSASRVQESLDHLCEDSMLSEVKTVAGIKKIYESQSVIAGSIYQIVNHPFYEQISHGFDFCVLLEPRNSLMTTSLGPLFRSKRFIVMRNIVDSESESSNSRETTEEEDTSLFGRLIYQDNVISI